MRRRVLTALAVASALAAGCADFRAGPLPVDDGGGLADEPSAMDARDDAVTADVPRADVPAASCTPSGFVCDPVAQTGCAGDTPACQASFASDGGGLRAACGAPGATVEGAACSAGACAAGLSCVDGVCHALCCASDPTACAGLAHAARCDVGLGMGAGGVHACGIVCDWTAHTGCTSGTQCLPVDATGETDCIATGTAVTNTHCDDGVHRCAASYLCVVPGGTSAPICRHLCDPTAATDTCTSGTCTALDGRPAAFGACIQ